MSPDFGENQININPDNPEQRAIKPRVSEVIEELTQSARLLNDPRALTMSPTPEKSPIWIEYESPDKLKYVVLNRFDLRREDYAPSKLPSQLREYERIIPISVQRAPFPNADVEDRKEDFVFLNLDKSNPKIFQLVTSYGLKLTSIHRLLGGEVAVDRPDLLPHILEAMSGSKNEGIRAL